jgi:hypothetical protein
MSRARCLVAFLLLVLSAALAKADGLLYQLPKDGSWATYDADMQAKGGPNGETMNAKGTLTLASVEQVTENGQPCRWIEVQFKLTMAMGEHKSEKIETYKVLIPEKYLAKGESPLEHVVRAWMQRGDGEPQKLTNPGDIDRGPLPLILSAPWKDAKQLDKAEVDCKLGKVVCEGAQGAQEFKNKQGKVIKCRFENRLHATSPFGVATSRWTMELPDMAKDAEMKWEMRLADFGDDAKSKMPDAK